MDTVSQREFKLITEADRHRFIEIIQRPNGVTRIEHDVDDSGRIIGPGAVDSVRFPRLHS